MTLVLDASVTVSWFLPDESTGYSQMVLENVLSSRALVPTIWALEITNVLLVAARRQRISIRDAERIVRVLHDDVPIDIEGMTGFSDVRRWLDLGARFGLSAYDASYLDLAQRENLPLATLDEALKVAAQGAGVVVYT